MSEWIKGTNGNYLGEQYQKKWDELVKQVCDAYYGKAKHEGKE